jgi:hypothetical protein
MTLASPLKSVISGNSIIRKRNGAGGNTELVRANGADLFLGAAVTFAGETDADPDVDLAAKTEPVDGIIVGPADTAIDLDKDSDDTYADNTWLKMYKPIPGDELYLTAKTNSSITYGGWLQVDGGFFINAENDDEYCCARALSAVTGATSTEAVFPAKWGKY